MISYHDLIIAENNIAYPIFDATFSIRLTCSRMAGWEVWNGETSIAVEYGDAPLDLIVKYEPVLKNRWTKKVDAQEFEQRLSLYVDIRVGANVVKCEYKDKRLTVPLKDHEQNFFCEYVRLFSKIFICKHMVEARIVARDAKQIILELGKPYGQQV